METILGSVKHIKETLDKISHPSGRPTIAYHTAKDLLNRIQSKFDKDMLEEIIDDIELSSNKKNSFSKRQKIELIRSISDELFIS